MSLQVATASFASTPVAGLLHASRILDIPSSGGFSSSGNNLDVRHHRRINDASGEFRSFANFVYRKNEDVTFVGADSAEAVSVVMPSHQEHDLLLVIAVNGDGQLPPVEPTGDGWTILRGGASGSQNIYGFTAAYKFAKSNTEIVGGWARATRISVAVYRNVREIGKTSFFSMNDDTNVRYVSSFANQSTGGTRIVAFQANENHLNVADAPTASGMTFQNRTNIDGVSPGVSLNDALAPNGANALQNFSILGQFNTASTGKQVAFTVTLLAGRPTIVCPYVDYVTTLNGDAVARTVFVLNKRYEANLTEFLFLYRRFYSGDKGSYSSSGSSVVLGKGFVLFAATGQFTNTIPDLVTARSLRFGTPGIGVTQFALTAFDTVDSLGFFVNPQNGSFTSITAGVTATHNAFIQQNSTAYTYSADADFIRELIFHLFGGTHNHSFGQVGLRNDGVSLVAGQPTGLPPSTQGGSSPSYPSFLRPQFNQFTNVNSSRDLGLLNNFLGNFQGEIGSQTGANTIFIKMTIVGPADFQIRKNKINKYTDRFVSIGLLNADRKQIEVNDFGFAYNNEIENTEETESLNPLPAGTYFFTISTDQWQAVPYDVTIQAIRFQSLSGSAVVSAALVGRFAISKLIGAALLSAPFATTIPPFNRIKQAFGPVLLTSGTRGQLVIPSGVAIGRMLPSGRLKKTHRLYGAATGTASNLATLSSAPPSYGGYGP